ncbi:OmpA family protein [Acetobacter sp. TBRC 12305]|uniref:OmpA family protein n=1 Tax=Acetobacter garciniae TaxID=2817435 RepID=A0A939HG75_9PROT|nr:OmpA family protein [Acetobacter garciniae]MBO1323795.1 OmpA family protein [Acetobacter garciniae]MBX0343484.1 OmpA family protein [Acetobacter garciniae]
MRLRTALLATTLMAAAPAAAFATTITGPYVNVGGGYNLVQNQHAHLAGDPPGGGSSQFRHNTGFTGFGAFGWGFGNGLRAEIEGAYNYSNIDHRPGTSIPGHTRSSDQAYGGFVNVLYDIDLKQFGIDAPVTPFVGVGAGYLWQHYNPVQTNFQGGGYTHIGGTNGGFAYQGIVGAAYDTGIPGFQITTEYRMIGQPGSFMDGAYQYSAVSATGARSSGHVNFDQRFNHQFILGLRYAFDTAPPPPPPAPVVAAPAPLPARSYLVFFDWDKSDLTARARQIVAEAAQASTHVQTTRIEVNGYTDNSSAHPGPRGEKYNLDLSVRRANSVKAELIRDGVPASAIDIHGYGEAHPLVPTGPNTREPQNRRVEIILH